MAMPATQAAMWPTHVHVTPCGRVRRADPECQHLYRRGQRRAQVRTIAAAGFESVVVELKPQSASYIADWLPGSGAEKYVCAANITAVKPGGCAKGAKAGTSCAKKEAPKVAPQVAAAMAC